MRNTSIISSTLGDYYSPDTKIIFIFAEQVHSISIYFPEGTVEPSLMATSPQQLPLYNGHFFWWTVHTFELVSTSLQWPLSSVPKVAVVRGSTVYKRGTFSVKNGIQLFRERVSEKVHGTMPKGIVGGFEFTVLQRNLQEWHERPWTYVYNR